MSPQLDERVDSEILEALDFEESPPTCDYTDCDQEAKAKLVCGVCGMIPGGGVEMMCAVHTVETAIIRAAHPQEQIVFDKTCLHRPEFGNCEIVGL